MRKVSFLEALEQIIREDKRYEIDAYVFLREGLDFASKMFDKPSDGPGRHVSGQELLEGIRVYARQEFGPMARRVLQRWGVTRTEDFGEIVFNMVGKGILGKTAEDSRADFAGVYDFDEVFVRPFLPPSRLKHASPGKDAHAAGPTTPREAP